ncbi:MAG TPA: lytic transglycosylase domain-containing protein [Pyrinomonadaceae bacterium]|nr:lytic transglycosylase domain-containing protein [Pyrinomonadaceae bacterium]
MKKVIPLVLITLVLSVAVYSQNGSRGMDNFDRSQGVQVYYPPAPAISFASRSAKKKGTPGSLVSKTGSTRKTASVDDGLATREAYLPARRSLIMGTGTHLNGFTTGNPVHDALIVESSRRYGIDPLLIYSQMHQESSFKITATSYKGASGLMQLMPATARRFGVTKIYDPKQNIDAGVRYMRWLLDTFNGDVVLALAGYNAGEGAVMKYGWNVPPYRETQEYVRRIGARYNSISDPRYVHTARRVDGQTAARLSQKDSRPLTVYEPDALAVRLSDGKMMLVNQ